MQAIQFTAPKEITIIDLPEPLAPGPGEALVRTHRMGICGTDLSCYLGKFPFFAYPRTPGHELGLEVVAVADVQRKLTALYELKKSLLHAPLAVRFNRRNLNSICNTIIA